MPRRKKKSNRGDQSHLSMWRKACQEHGYLKKGGKFRPMPKKTDPEHAEIMATYMRMKQSM